MADTLEHLSTLARRFTELLDNQDWQAIEARVGRPCVAHVGGQDLDRETWLGMGQMFYRGFPDARHVIERQIAQSDVVVTIARFLGTHRGEFMGIPPSEHKVGVPMILVDRFENGLIVEHWGQFDATGLMQQIARR